MNNSVALPVNFKKDIDSTIRMYIDQGVELPDGFQKDAIQNAMGARPSEKSFDNWKCSFSIEKNSKGTFLIVEDTGTLGLVGRNMSMSEISLLSEKEMPIPPTERLARFSSLFNSGGNTAGAGLYGLGKKMYAAVSDTCTYAFDSLREDGLYVANQISNGKIQEQAFEDEEAKHFILEATGFSCKTTIGTRIIIASPKQEIVDSFNDGSFARFIQESWWIIIGRLPVDSGIFVNGVKVPSLPAIAYTHEIQLNNIEAEPGYRVKHFGLFVSEEGKNPLSDFNYHRIGMKIGPIDISDAKVPEKIATKFWGYVEVEKKWEEELSEIEDSTHSGVSAGKKRRLCFQVLKRFCIGKVHESLIKWGYVKAPKNEDTLINEELQAMAKDLQGLFKNLGYEKLGTGNSKDALEARLKGIQYPEKGSRRVTDYDKISFDLIIKNNLDYDRKVKITANVINAETKEVVSHISESVVTVVAENICTEPFAVGISRNTATDGIKNIVSVKISPVKSSSKGITKELPFWFNCDEEKNNVEDVFLTLNSCIFPKANSKRVNQNDYLLNVAYRIENRRNEYLDYLLKVSLNDGNNPSNEMITKIADIKGRIGPFEETIETIGEILFDKDLIENYMDKGIVDLKATLVAASDGNIYKRGEKISVLKSKVFYNCDDKKGFDDSFVINSIKEPNNYRRSWNEVIGDKRFIYLNIAHEAFERIKNNEDNQRDYMWEQMLKQYVLLYLKEGKYEVFGINPDTMIDEPVEFVEKITDKIEATFKASLGD